MALKQLICIFLISIVWTSAIDVDKLQITIGSRNVSIKIPGNFKLKVGNERYPPFRNIHNSKQEARLNLIDYTFYEE